MWTVELLENALGFWNNTMQTIWGLATQSPKDFQGGAIWSSMELIFSGLQGIAYGLLLLFFAMTFFHQATSFRDLKHPEQVFRLAIRFVMAKTAVTYGLDIINMIFEITGGITASIAGRMGGLHAVTATLPSTIQDAIEEVGMFERAFIMLVGLVLFGIVIALSITMLLTVYGRFFRIYLYAALAPLPLSAFGGELTSRHGRSYIQNLIGVCLEGAIIVVACVIFSAYASSGANLTIALGDSGIGLVTSYMMQVCFEMFILLGIVKSADRVVKEMLAL